MMEQARIERDERESFKNKKKSLKKLLTKVNKHDRIQLTNRER